MLQPPADQDVEDAGPPRVRTSALSGRRAAAPLLTSLVLGLTGCMNAPAASDTRASATSTPPGGAVESSAPQATCPASGLSVSVGPVDGAAGLRAVTMTVLNCGPGPVVVEGYPGLRLLDDERAVIEVAVMEEPDPIGGAVDVAVTPVDLPPGQTAQSVLLWRNTVELGLDNTPGSYLGITATPESAEQVIEIAVDLGTTGELTVGPWRAA